jgi:hypothetical protein
MSVLDDEIELSPPQPPGVLRVVADALARPAEAVDPWWQAGLDDALAPQ